MAPLRLLSAVPVWLPFLVILALLLTGSFLGGPVGLVLLALPLLFLTWMLYLTWPVLRVPERAMRLAVLVLVVGIAVTQAIPR